MTLLETDVSPGVELQHQFRYSSPAGTTDCLLECTQLPSSQQSKARNTSAKKSPGNGHGGETLRAARTPTRNTSLWRNGVLYQFIRAKWLTRTRTRVTVSGLHPRAYRLHPIGFQVLRFQCTLFSKIKVFTKVKIIARGLSSEVER